MIKITCDFTGESHLLRSQTMAVDVMRLPDGGTWPAERLDPRTVAVTSHAHISWHVVCCGSS